MFPRDRVIASLNKYNLAFDENATDDELRNELARFYARQNTDRPAHRSQRLRPGDPVPRRAATPCTTGHIIPVDGGLTEAFLR